MPPLSPEVDIKGMLFCNINSIASTVFNWFSTKAKTGNNARKSVRYSRSHHTQEGDLDVNMGILPNLMCDLKQII